MDYAARLRQAQQRGPIRDHAWERAMQMPFLDDKPMDGPPSCTERDFRRPHLRQCTFDFSTIIWGRKLGGGLDGCVWKVWFGDTGPFALKVFWDTEPPDFYHYYAPQRECQNAAILQMLEAAIAKAPKPIRVLADPRDKLEARHNLFWFSDEAHSESFPEEFEAVEITSMPRFTKCYGWLKFNSDVFLDLPLRLKAEPRTISKVKRFISPSKEYTAIVYEYIEKGENDEAVVEEVDRFCWLTGFAHTLSPLARNWRSGVLVDHSDIVCARGYGSNIALLMATLVSILYDIESIITSMESIGPRLQNPRLRPSDQEVTQLHELATRMLERAQCLRDKSISCASEWTSEIFQKSDEHMSRAQSAIRTAAQGKVKWSILRRNLAAIYQGHSASVVDSPSLKARKARKAQKSLTLRKLGAGAILAWGVSLPPSLWEEMDQLVFNDVTKQMTEAAVGSEPISEIALNARDIIRDLGKEEPFCGIESYHHFVHEVENLACKQPHQRPSKKRRLDDNEDIQGIDFSVCLESHTGEGHMLANQTIVAIPDVYPLSTYPGEALLVNGAPDCRWT
ncbi:hypothetical protein N0V84_008676 [Fusarium piperis]|uniref:Uncharacterized protein n=1 Tax=Fusarium piperis TaxID=1435070 RepID=A0A9W9BK40_9HYPO|nr:hypothetical protein N0V84_008676 [Fusarium piperis]